MDTPAFQRIEIKMTRVLAFLICFLIGEMLPAQVFLQLERAESLEVEKFFSGEELIYKTTDIDRWQKGIILQVIPEGSSLLFDDQLLSVNQISRIKLYKPKVRIFGRYLMAFGATWLTLGGAIEGLNAIGALDSGYRFGWDTAGIGISGLAIGFIMDRFLGTEVRRINKVNRLRIMDINF